MKTYNDLYDDIISIPNLLVAFNEAKKGKKSKKFRDFEKNLIQNLNKLHDELRQKTYKPSGYSVFYVQDYKRRKVLAPAFRDHVVHHAIFNYLEQIYDPTFIHTSCACRKGKGTHFGLRTLKSFVNKYSENDYFIKCDVSKYFYSIDQYKLKEIIKRKIKDENVIWLLEQIIDSLTEEKISAQIDNNSFIIQKKGIPIGNLLSQLFANIYLNELDYFIKHELKIKHYVRYVDDFVILHKSKTELKKISSEIKKFLREELFLKLEDRKIQMNKISFGIDFIGYVVFKKYVRVRTRNYRRFREKMAQKPKEIWKLFLSFRSYLAHLSHTNSEKIKKRIVAEFIKRAVQRGGNWDNGANAGPFSANLNNAPSNRNPNIGFRCCTGFLTAEFSRKSCNIEMHFHPLSENSENLRRYLQDDLVDSPMKLENFNKIEVKQYEGRK